MAMTSVTTDAGSRHWGCPRLDAVADGNWLQELNSGTGFENTWIGTEARMDRVFLGHQPLKKRLEPGDPSALS